MFVKNAWYIAAMADELAVLCYSGGSSTNPW